MFGFRLLFLATAIALLPMQTLAADNEKICAGTAADGYTPEAIIAACTNVIENANYPGILAGAYYNRGNAHYDKADFANAIADYDHALHLRPNYPTALFNRGLAKKRSGDSAGGDADIAASKAMRSQGN
jgi:tetratricopeptide (TPR) repeat protein